MVSPQSNGLSQVGEAERFGRRASENGAQTISAMSAHDPSREGAHAHVRYSRVLDWMHGVNINSINRRREIKEERV